MRRVVARGDEHRRSNAAIVVSVILPRRAWLGARLAADGTVDALVHDSPAQACGLCVGDRVVAIDGVAMADADAVVLAVRSLRADATLQWHRGGRVLEAVMPRVARPVEEVDGAAVEHGEIVVDGLRQRTIVTRPVGASRSPVVVFLAGSTIDSVESVPARPSPLADWIAGLAQAGITTWRVEKRGVGDSEGDAASADFDAEVNAAREVIACATADGGAPPVVFGHSTGGMIAALVGGSRGIVAYGTWAERFSDAMIVSLARQRPDAHEANRRDAALVRKVIVEGASLGDVLAADPDLRSASALTGSTLWGRIPTYFAQLERCDLAAAWRAIDVPTSLLHGERDRITTLAQHEAIAAMVAAATVRSIAGHAHDMAGPTTAVVDATIDFVRRIV